MAVPNEVRRVQDVASAVVPGIVVEEIIHSTDKSLVATGLLGDRGVIVKLLIAEDPYWRKKVANEIDSLIQFRDDPPPIAVAELIAADLHQGVVIVGKLPGAALAD